MRLLAALFTPLIAVAFFVFTYPQGKEVVTIDTGEKRYIILAELADTFDERRKGLMGRESMTDEEGMLFIFPKPDKPAFWMKNMRMPIDMVFIRADGVVDTIEKNVPPCPPEEACLYYGPESEVTYVLELAAGWADRQGFEVGDRVEFDKL